MILPVAEFLYYVIMPQPRSQLRLVAFQVSGLTIISLASLILLGEPLIPCKVNALDQIRVPVVQHHPRDITFL